MNLAIEDHSDSLSSVLQGHQSAFHDNLNFEGVQSPANFHIISKSSHILNVILKCLF